MSSGSLTIRPAMFEVMPSSRASREEQDGVVDGVERPSAHRRVVMPPCCTAFGNEPAGRSDSPGSGSRLRMAGCPCGGRVRAADLVQGWIRVGGRPRLGVFPAVVEGDRERVWGSVAEDGVGQWLDDRRWPALIRVAQSAGPEDSVLVTHTREVGSRPRVMQEHRHRQRQAPSVWL
jgi:hypothetical protein